MCNTEAAAQQQQRLHNNKDDRATATSIEAAAGGLSAAAAGGGVGATASAADYVDVGVDHGCRLKKASELWHIHGKRFDLSGFLKHHPGGSSILQAVRGAEDATALFESYHALANTEAIRQSLRKFEWTGKVLDDVSEREAALVGGKGKQPVRYRWDEAGFYAVLKTRVKRHFLEKYGHWGVDPMKVSVNRFVKAPLSWYVKEVFIVAIYVPMFVYMLGYDMLRLGGASVSGWARAGFAVLAGAVLQAFSFCTLHDASHYGLWSKRPRAQEVLSRVCNAWTLWHHGLWVMHHVYGHHSFTGDPERDPDLVHARPYLRKSVLTPKEQYDPFLVRWQRFLAPLFMMVLPGATLGQTQAYVRAAHVGHLWHVSITEASGGTLWYEYLTYILALGSHVLAGNFWVSFCYFMGISVAYHLCVAPDHDTFESSVVNSIETKKREEKRRKRASASTTTVAAAATTVAAGRKRAENPSNGSSSGSGNSGLEGGPAEEAEAREPPQRRRQSGQSIECGSSRGLSVLEGEPAASTVAAKRRFSRAGRGVPIAGPESCHSEPPQEVEEEEEGDDWGEVQVRHSGNFSNGNFFVTQAMGGINYQIEHHLFPSVSHMLYEEIAPIVREACREFCIPYNAHPTLWSAYKSYLKHLVVCSDLADSTPQESKIAAR